MAFYKDVNSTTSTDRPDVTDVKAIIQGLQNLLRTNKGEIPFNPNFGISLEDNLFDLMDEGTRLEVLADVFDAVDNFEPRVELRRGKSTVILFEDENKIEITLVFRILGLSDDGKLFTVTESFQG